MSEYDVMIIGGGPAGLSAATLLGAEGKRVLLLERESDIGGQISHSSWVENLLPFSDGFSGEHFRTETRKQIEKFGVVLVTGTPVVMLEKVATKFPQIGQGVFMLNQHYFGRAVLLATGLAPKTGDYEIDADCSVRLAPRLLETVEPGDSVLIVGGGNSAAQAALHYRRRGANVTFLVRKSLEETMDGYYVRQMEPFPQYYGDFLGADSDNGLARVAMRFTTGEIATTHFNHIHVLTGSVPDTSWLPAEVQRDDSGYVITDRRHMTTLPGLFAVGDCESDSVKRLSCAIGNAGEVARFINQYMRGELK